MPKGKSFFLLCLSFVAGVFVSSFTIVPWQLLLAFFIFSLILVIFFKTNKTFLIIGFIAFMIGVFCYSHEAKKIFASELRVFNDNNENVILVGIVNSEPDLKDNSQQLTLRVGKENLLIITSKYPNYHYGDKVKVFGKLKTPENFEKFDYQGYLQKERIYSMTVFPKIELLESGQGNIVKQALFSFKLKFHQAWQKFLSPPHLGIFEALVFGEESSISKEWKTQLNLAGVRHLTAVSGMNITIISFLLTGIFLSLGFWRQQASLASLISIWLYILMIGAPASGLRAGLMVSLLLAAQASGKLIDGLRSLLFSAVILLAENPLILRFDAGFQLSFLAMAGIIIWQPFFKDRVFKKLPEFFKLNLATTLSSQVFTLPILIYNFGYFSLIAPLANLLLVPIIPYLTMIGFVFGSLGIVSAFLAKILSWFLWLATSYILLIVDLFLKIPFSYMIVEKVPVAFLIFSYFLLILASWQLGLLRKKSFV
ncbi:ComEC family competence protein [Candidatus Parcubacteria bacterium]|nr:ComEC family competence protein [Patescibacteria group bacterium]MBU4467053.1 ComEC family competence protein [Patescibacteria group bacterium]MCG2688391.1 ComEC family competence protein [Candidatus Parcubacteria bacterium]